MRTSVEGQWITAAATARLWASRFLISSTLAVAMLVAGCKRPTLNEEIAALPPVIGGRQVGPYNIVQTYTVDPYIEVAEKLQRLGREGACSALLRAATNASAFPGLQVYALCRMVFTNHPGTYFRQPRIGVFTFVGDTANDDWPLAPIEVVDGVPFVVATRWALSGQMEPPAAYVRYCMSDCVWNSTRFAPRTKAQKQAALAKLLASKKRRTGLAQWDKDFLAAQLK